MAPHNPSHLASTDDSFQRASKRLLKILGDHPRASRALIGSLVLVLAASAGGLWLSRWQARQAGYALAEAFALKDVRTAGEQHEATLLRQAQPSRQDDGDDDGDDAQDDGDEDDDETMDALHDDTLPQFADAKARDNAALGAFTALAHGHPGPLGTVAALEAAALAQGEPAGSRQALLAQAAAKLPASNSLLSIAALRQAQLAEDAGDVDAALDAYGRIVTAQIRFLGDEAQLQRARLLTDKGDLEAARQALEDVQNNYPQSSLTDEVRIHMAALDAKLGAQAPQTPALLGASAG